MIDPAGPAAGMHARAGSPKTVSRAGRQLWRAKEIVISVAATMSSTVAPRLRSQTGRAKPCRKGPMACAPASSWQSLYAMLPASSLLLIPSLQETTLHTWPYQSTRTRASRNRMD